MSLFTAYNSFAGVISKDEKTLNEGKTGKSAEKALIEQKMQSENQQQNNVVTEVTKTDYYSLLGITKYANQDAIKNQYIKVGKKYYSHAKANDANNLKKFNEVSEAYLVLSNPENKKIYDANGHAAFANMDFSSINYLSIYKDLFEPSEIKYEMAKAPVSRESRAMLDSRMVPAEVSVEKDTTYSPPSASSQMQISETVQRIEQKAPARKILGSILSNIEDVFSPKSISNNKTVYDSALEPSAVREEVQSMPERGEVQSGISATALLKANVDSSRREYIEEQLAEDEENKSKKRFYDWKTKKYLENVNTPKDEDKEGRTISSDQKPIGTQLGHTQLYDNLYEKNRVIAAGGGGGLGEGGGTIKQEDYGSGGTSYVITDAFSNMPSEVTISHVTSDDPGNDLINETVGKAKDEGEYNEADKGNFAGKKIFEIERNGDLGIDNKPEGIDNGKLIMLLGVVGTFIVGVLSFTATSYNARRRQEFF